MNLDIIIQISKSKWPSPGFHHFLHHLLRLDASLHDWDIGISMDRMEVQSWLLYFILPARWTTPFVPMIQFNSGSSDGALPPLLCSQPWTAWLTKCLEHKAHKCIAIFKNFHRCIIFFQINHYMHNLRNVSDFSW